MKFSLGGVVDPRGSGVDVRCGEAEFGRGVRLGYRPELDGLRGVAVLAVVLFHFWGTTALVSYRGMTLSFGGGYLGVDLFFVLSGFLITRLLLEERQRHDRISLPSFYGRRLARLFPAVALLLVGVAAYATLSPRHHFGEVRLGVVAGLLYFANWVGAAGGNLGPLGHLWSLSVEEQFYVVWPVVVVVAGTTVRRVRRIAAVGLVVGAIDMLVRSLLGQSGWAITFSTDSRGLLCLMTGCWLAGWLATQRPLAGRVQGRAVAAATLGGVVFAAFILLNPSTDVMARGGFVAVVAAVVALVIGALEWPALGRVLAWSPLQQLGRISYSVYLWHPVVYWYLRDLRPSMPVHTAYNLVCVVVSFAIAAASYHLVEAPLRRRISQRLATRHTHDPRPALAFTAPTAPLRLDPVAPPGSAGGE